MHPTDTIYKCESNKNASNKTNNSKKYSIVKCLRFCCINASNKTKMLVDLPQKSKEKNYNFYVIFYLTQKPTKTNRCMLFHKLIVSLC